MSVNYKEGTVLSSHLDLPAILGGKNYFYLHFTDEETGFKRLSNSLGHDKVRIRTQVCLTPKAISCVPSIFQKTGIKA